MFTADANFELGFRLASSVNGQLDKLSDAGLVQRNKRILRKNTLADVVREKFPGIISTQTERHLGQIICAKGKEISDCGNPVSHQCRARNLNHCPNRVGDAEPIRSCHLDTDLFNPLAQNFEFALKADEWDHDWPTWRRMLPKYLEELLDPDLFVRVHRSTIVNRKRVRSLRPHRNGEYFLTLDNRRELKLSRSYKANLDRLVG